MQELRSDSSLEGNLLLYRRLARWLLSDTRQKAQCFTGVTAEQRAKRSKKRKLAKISRKQNGRNRR